MKQKDRIRFRAEGLNTLLGGGLEPGVITNVFGGAGTGKTLFSMEACLSLLEMDGKAKAVFIDTEGGFSPERFVQIGGERVMDRLLVRDVKTFEEQDEVIRGLEEIVRKERVGLVVVDSLVALYRLARDEEVQEANSMLSRQMATLSRIAREHGIPVVVTNQVYSDFDTGELELVGRDIPKYYSKCMILLEKQGIGKRRAILMKHRHKPEGETVLLEIREEGFVDCKGEGEKKKRFGII